MCLLEWEINMNKEFKNIELSESVILGWEVTGNTVTLYIEFLLTGAHKEFVKFDSNTQFGCYKIGQVIFDNTRNVNGFNADVLKPCWNENLNEYTDVYEIDSFVYENSLVKIQSNNLLISFECDNFTVNLEKFEKYKT